MSRMFEQKQLIFYPELSLLTPLSFPLHQQTACPVRDQHEEASQEILCVVYPKFQGFGDFQRVIFLEMYIPNV